MALADTTEVPDALYNRYRPHRLSELVGQDHVVVPLRRAFEKGRIHHAYLLTGPRGCGKTSTARILAAGLVCETGPTADPCNECDQCTAVMKGNHLDVVEIDAASNRSIDEMRSLREKTHYAPAIGRYKVIVIDEAHQILKEAASVLLKLIEEPPPHVRFIFATTDPDKMLQTIRSRTYHYSFRLVPAPAAAAHIESIVAKEGGTLDDGVLALIVRAGGGSMRDSLSTLGQLLDGSDNGRVRLDEAAALLGATADTVLDEALDALANRDTSGVLNTIGAAIDTGADPMGIAADLLDRLRDLLLLATTGALPPLAEIASTERQTAWRDIATKLGVRGLTTACEVLQKAIANPYSGQPRITLEVAAARILLEVNDTVDVNTALIALTNQVAELARTVAAPRQTVQPELYAGTPATPPTPSTPTPTVTPPGIVQHPSGDIGGVNHDFAPGGIHDNPLGGTPTDPTTPLPPAAVTTSASDWPRILEAIKTRRRATAMILNSAEVQDISNGTITLAAKPGFEHGFRANRHAEIVTAAATEILGGTWMIEVKVTP